MQTDFEGSQFPDDDRKDARNHLTWLLAQNILLNVVAVEALNYTKTQCFEDRTGPCPC